MWDQGSFEFRCTSHLTNDSVAGEQKAKVDEALDIGYTGDQL